MIDIRPQINQLRLTKDTRLAGVAEALDQIQQALDQSLTGSAFEELTSAQQAEIPGGGGDETELPGAPGLEWADPVIVLLVEDVQIVEDANGWQAIQFKLTFTPPIDTRWKAIDVVLMEDATYQTLRRVTTSGETFTVGIPVLAADAFIYACSVDSKGRVNTIVEGVTPKDRVSLPGGTPLPGGGGSALPEAPIGGWGGLHDLGQSLLTSVGAALSVVAGVLGVSPYGITSEMLGNFSVNSQKLANLSVITEKIASGAVTSLKIGYQQVYGSNIAYLAVGSANIANGSVGTLQISSGAITNALIGSAAVTSGKIGYLEVLKENIAYSSVDTSRIADLAVTEAKIASMSVSKLTAGTIGHTYIDNYGNITLASGNSLSVTPGSIHGTTIYAMSAGSGWVITPGFSPSISSQGNSSSISANRMTASTGDFNTLYGGYLSVQSFAINGVSGLTFDTAFWDTMGNPVHLYFTQGLLTGVGST